MAAKRKSRRGLGAADHEHRSEVHRVLGLFNNKAGQIEKALRDKPANYCYAAIAGIAGLASLKGRLDANYGDVSRHTPDVKHKMARAQETWERLWTRSSGCIRRD